MVLHYWANAELERNNVRNARVVLAEALRKCPMDQPLYTLAAGVELAGGDLGGWHGGLFWRGWVHARVQVFV